MQMTLTGCWPRPWVPGLALALALALSAPLETQAGDLDFGVAGEASFTAATDPIPYLRQPKVQAALLAAADAPISREALASALAGSGATPGGLVSAGLLRAEGADGFRIAFNLFTISDQRRMRAIGQEFSVSLADALIKDRTLAGLLSDYRLEGVDRRAVAFALVGCAILDWDGLKVTAAGGLRSSGPVRPAGTYLIWARESEPDLSTRGVFWAGRDSEAGGVHLASIGDSYAERRTFPDVGWGVGDVAGEAPPAFKRLLANSVQAGVSGAQTDIGRMLLALRSQPMSSQALQVELGLGGETLAPRLEAAVAMGYVRQDGDLYRLRVPVFGPQDADLVRRIREAGDRVLRAWLARNYPTIRQRLSDLSAVRAGTPYEQVFTDAWHDIFGWTNRRLTVLGYFPDPYGPESTHGGYQPFAWSAELKLKD